MAKELIKRNELITGKYRNMKYSIQKSKRQEKMQELDGVD